MSQRTALVAGASGLVGGYLLDRLLDAPEYGRVISLGRRTLERNHPKLEQRTVELAQLATLAPFPAADDVFCCLGTTIRRAGSEEAFRQVDHDAVLALARAARPAGATQFLLVSALGANPRSRVFYNRVKGEVEDAVGSVGYPSFIVFRPSILEGPRAESRPGERLGLAFARVFSPLLGKFRPTLASDVAAAMVSEALRRPAGRVEIDSLRITELARRPAD